MRWLLAGSLVACVGGTTTDGMTDDSEPPVDPGAAVGSWVVTTLEVEGKVDKDGFASLVVTESGVSSLIFGFTDTGKQDLVRFVFDVEGTVDETAADTYALDAEGELRQTFLTGKDAAPATTVSITDGACTRATVEGAPQLTCDLDPATSSESWSFRLIMAEK